MLAAFWTGLAVASTGVVLDVAHHGTVQALEDDANTNESVRRLRVATWNVLADEYISDEAYPRVAYELLVPEARRAAICGLVTGLIDRLGLDLICLQEVDDALVEALHGIAAPRGWQTSWSRIAMGRAGCGAVVCGGWRLAAADRVRVSEGTLERLTVERGAVSLVIHHAHFHWADDGGQGTLRQARRVVRRADASEGAAVVLGDLNAGPDSDALAHLVRSGFADAHGDKPGLMTAVFEESGAVRTDYVLGRGLVLSALETGVSAIDGDRSLPDNSVPSDHVPLAAEILLPP